METESNRSKVAASPSQEPSSPWGREGERARAGNGRGKEGRGGEFQVGIVRWRPGEARES
jgi:hypothetical protein